MNEVEQTASPFLIDDPSPPPDQPVSVFSISAEHIMVPDADFSLFGNEMGFNGLGIHLREPIVLVNNSDGPALTAITERGLVLTTDRDEDLDPSGFHHHLIPWSSILFLHQYIAT